MFLIVGLGNPEARYQNTRHNVGFLFCDYLQEKVDSSVSFADNQRFDAELLTLNWRQEKLMLLKPQTYMNNSGYSVSKAASYYNIPAGRVIVVLDDVDLPLGKMQIKLGGGSAGHNGVKSVQKEIGTADFVRLRVGVGRPDEDSKMPLSSWVLGQFADADLAELDKVFVQAMSAVEMIITEGLKSAQNNFN